jgi:hypothetical protein
MSSGARAQGLPDHEMKKPAGQGTWPAGEAQPAVRAFSSEVDAGSREENASKQKIRARF